MTVAALTTSTNYIYILELDQGLKLAQALGIDPDLAQNSQLLHSLLQALMKRWASQCSGVILDPVLGMTALSSKPETASLLLSLEKPSLNNDPQGLPQLQLDWGVEAIKENYAVAKLELSYHPDEPQALLKKQMLAEIHDYCQHEGIDLLVKLHVTMPPLTIAPDKNVSKPTESTDFQMSQLTAIQELRQWWDIVALEYPGDALGCATITTELDSPWLLMTDQYSYAEGKEKIRESVENGAVGCLIGQIIWRDIERLRLKDASPDLPAIEEFITHEGRDRVMELKRIIAELATK